MIQVGVNLPPMENQSEYLHPCSKCGAKKIYLETDLGEDGVIKSQIVKCLQCGNTTKYNYPRLESPGGRKDRNGTQI